MQDAVQIVLASYGGIVLVLRGVIAILKAVPGDQGEGKIEKVLHFVESAFSIFTGKK